MSIQNFLKARKGDPDWTFTPDHFFGKEFKIINAHEIELSSWKSEAVILRQNSTEREPLAKKISMEIKENAVLDLTLINDAADRTQQVFIYDILIRESGQLNLGLFLKGGTLNKHILTVSLENYANFNIFGHIQNRVGGDCEVITRTIHQGSCSNSHQFFTAESGPESQTVFQAVTQIPSFSQFSEASIESSSLVTGHQGKCHGSPNIYNHADNSKTTVVSATDFLDPERVYYLQTRGMDKKTAQQLLINKHRNKTLDLVINEEIRQELKDMYF